MQGNSMIVLTMPVQLSLAVYMQPYQACTRPSPSAWTKEVCAGMSQHCEGQSVLVHSPVLVLVYDGLG